IANSIINAAPGHAQIWLADVTASVRYYNVLWCEGARDPSPDDPTCRTRPWLIEGDDIAPEAAAGRVTELNRNPLPEVSPFFRTRAAGVVIEYSSDRGAHWRRLDLLNAGDDSGPPRGDPRYRVPASLERGENWFRARILEDGALGPPSSIVTATGEAP